MDDFIQHYASKYYDPEKWHEYYMEHRELKNKEKSESDLSEAQLQSRLTSIDKSATLHSVRSGVNDAKQQDLANARTTVNTQIKQLQSSVQTRLNSLSERVKKQLTSLSNQKKTDVNKNMDELAKKQSENAKDKREKLAQEKRNTQREIDRLKKQMKAVKSNAQKISIQRQINSLNRQLSRNTATIERTNKQASLKNISNARKNASNIQANYKVSSEYLREYQSTNSVQYREEAKNAIAKARETLKNNLETIRKNYKTTMSEELQKVKDSYTTNAEGNATDTGGTNSWSEQIEAASKYAKEKTAERIKRNKNKK